VKTKEEIEIAMHRIAACAVNKENADPDYREKYKEMSDKETAMVYALAWVLGMDSFAEIVDRVLDDCIDLSASIVAETFNG
jgi:hypothetical protein